MEKKTNVAIIGSGLAGIALARKIQKLNPIIIEKSKGIGGRIATRRLGQTFVNHGAESFEVKHPYLTELIKEGLENQLLQFNPPIVTPSGHLNQWVKLLAKDLTIFKETEVFKIENRGGCILLKNKNDDPIIETKKLVFCLPSAQTAQILKNSKLEAAFLDSLKYKSQIQFFLLTRNKIPSVLENSQEYFLKKWHHFSSEGFLYHFEIRDDRVSDFLDYTKEEVSSYFLQHFQSIKHLILEHHSHKWRYSRVTSTIDPNFQWTHQNLGIYLCGDYFYGDDFNAVMNSVLDLTPSLLKSP